MPRNCWPNEGSTSPTKRGGAGVIGLGRLALSRHERMVAIEPRSTGMVLFMLRAADEVPGGAVRWRRPGSRCRDGRDRSRDHQSADREFDPATYRDRYQEALRELIEAKMQGLTVKPREMAAPPPAIDLMAALKRSLAQAAPASKRLGAAPRKAPKTKADRRQPALLLPVSGGRKPRTEGAAERPARAPRRRKRA
jgi:DNA end-binding protein Ku